jgi:uncharacterized protein
VPGPSWIADPLAGRRAERERLIGLARGYVADLSRQLPLAAAVVAGSVARGDFNLWSDVDVVIVSDALPEPGPDRATALGAGGPPHVEPHGYTSTEFRRGLARGDRLACEALAHGVLLHGTLPS